MRFTKKTIGAVVAATLVLGLVVIVGIGFGAVKLWPVVRTWTQNTLGVSDIDSARRVVAQVGAQLGDERIVQLSRAGADPVALAALAGNPELAGVLKWTATLPALGPLVQNGGYRQALEEAIRQNVPDIAQIRLDQVASPEVRAMVAKVQQVVAENPQGAEAASTVNANVLNLLKSEAFALLCRNPDVSRILSGPEPAKKAE